MCDAGAGVLDGLWFVVLGGWRTAPTRVGLRCGNAGSRGVVFDGGLRDLGWLWIVVLGGSRTAPTWVWIAGGARMGGMLCAMPVREFWIGYGSWSWAVHEPPLGG